MYLHQVSIIYESWIAWLNDFCPSFFEKFISKRNIRLRDAGIALDAASREYWILDIVKKPMHYT